MSIFCSLFHTGGTALPFSASSRTWKGQSDSLPLLPEVSRCCGLEAAATGTAEWAEEWRSMGQAPRNGCKSMPLRWWPPSCTHSSQLSLTRAAKPENSGDRQVWRAMPPTSQWCPIDEGLSRSALSHSPHTIMKSHSVSYSHRVFRQQHSLEQGIFWYYGKYAQKNHVLSKRFQEAYTFLLIALTVKKWVS